MDAGAAGLAPKENPVDAGAAGAAGVADAGLAPKENPVEAGAAGVVDGGLEPNENPLDPGAAGVVVVAEDVLPKEKGGFEAPPRENPVEGAVVVFWPNIPDC